MMIIPDITIDIKFRVKSMIIITKQNTRYIKYNKKKALEV